MEEGALGIVLLISRIAGVAPFLRGAEYRVSLPLVIFAKLFISITAIDFIIISAVPSNLFHKKYDSIKALEILMVASNFFAIISTLVSVFKSPERIIRVLRYLKQLNQIDKQILGDCAQYRQEIKLTVLILIYLHLCLGLRGLFLKIENINETILNFLFLITHYMINLSQLQVGLFARRTMLSLKVINSSLIKFSKISPIKDIPSQIFKTRQKRPILAWEKVKQQSCNLRSMECWLVKTRPENIEEPAKWIRQCVTNYLSVCDIITASIDGDGLLIVILLILDILNLLKHSYNIILYALASGSNLNTYYIFGEFCWCFVYFTSVIIFLEPYHKTHSEIQKLQYLVMSLRWIHLDEVDVSKELHLFKRVININKPKSSPLGMFTLDRILIIKIFGGLVTYLVIMVTYGPKLDNHNLITE